LLITQKVVDKFICIFGEVGCFTGNESFDFDDDPDQDMDTGIFTMEGQSQGVRSL